MMMTRRDFLVGTAAVASCLPQAVTALEQQTKPVTPLLEPEKMQLMILGSCASEGCPSPYCTCPLCQKARTEGGKDVRLRAGYQLGEDIRIDWSPDALAQAKQFNLKPWLLKHIFITHTHEDHLLPMDFWTRGVTVENNGTVAKVYGNKEVIAAIGKAFGNDWKNNHLEPVTLVPGKSIKIPEHQMSVTPLLANHMKTEQALLYLFATPSWKLFIASDTSYFPASTWEALKGQQIDVLLIDSTWGMVRRNDGHLGVPNIVDIVERMKKEGSLKEHAKVIPTHMSHHGTLPHSEMETQLAPLGLDPAFDGKTIQLPL